ncbi:MAG: TatD family deoxyribonuclease [Candidatus Kapabacteria bacterium]|nr:TatD family deoxyribonuclease [Candidatus Kapabacteria bacterium]
MFYDCHTHHPVVDADVVCVRSVRLGVDGMPADGPCSVGIHPWDAATATLDLLDAAVGRPNVVAIGETGLDRACAVPLHVQLQVFRLHIERSERLHLPLVIHCVRAFDDVLAERRACSASMPWIIHGMNKFGDVAARLVAAGCYVSFGTALLNTNAPARTAIKQVPDNRLLLETDDIADVRIADVYAAAATLRHVSIDDLCLTLQANFNTVFKR